MTYTFNLKTLLLASCLVVPLLFGNVIAQDEAPAAAAAAESPVQDYLDLVDSAGADLAPAFDFFTVSMLWTVIAAAMVFIMHLGFATLEAGLTQSKNTINILFKNVWIISVGLLTYAAMGFNTHYPCGSWQIENWIGFNGPISGLTGG